MKYYVGKKYFVVTKIVVRGDQRTEVIVPLSGWLHEETEKNLYFNGFTIRKSVIVHMEEVNEQNDTFMAFYNDLMKYKS